MKETGSPVRLYFTAAVVLLVLESLKIKEKNFPFTNRMLLLAPPLQRHITNDKMLNTVHVGMVLFAYGNDTKVSNLMRGCR